MANVNPEDPSTHTALSVPDIELDQDTELTGYSALVRVTGGTINDLYGGNDITGTVKGGGVLDIRSSIEGDIYGGGNGSYAYTDYSDVDGPIDYYSEYYYAPGANSITALNAHRPNAERVYINVEGQAANNKAILYGSLYGGGNSASLTSGNDDDKLIVRIGKHVIADNVFLGNNGANMIDQDILELYAGSVNPTTGVLATGAGTKDFSTIDLASIPFVSPCRRA